MRITSSAPTRIDLAGGTIDIWPLYLFHEDAQTLNAAISLRARCELSAIEDGRIEIASADTGRTVRVRHWSELQGDHELKLIGHLLRYFRAGGIRVATASQSPVGAGIAGSSAMNVAVCGAVAAWQKTKLEDDVLLQVAMNVEAQAIDVPTGAQDFRPALYGGVSAVELRPDGVKRVPLAVDPRALEAHIVLVYTGASRQSGINNWEVTKRHIDGDRSVFDRFERIRDIAIAMREALGRGDWSEVGRQIAAEWDNRKGLAPGVTTLEIERLISAGREAGAQAAKVCGAGGGGCMILFADPSRVPTVKAALTAAGAKVLDYRVEPQGLIVDRG